MSDSLASGDDAADALSSAIDQLTERVQQADFVAAIRILDKAFPAMPGLGRASRLRDEPVRLSQMPTLGFRNNALQSLEKTAAAHPYRLYCNFMGLFGHNGPLPLHLTEYSMQRAEHHNDPTFLEFVDLFNHRMLSLFYLAIADADPVINMDRDKDNRYSEFVAAICGLLPAAASRRDSLSDSTKYKFASWLGARTRSPDGLASILGECFELHCEIEEFVGDWLPIPPDAQISLGSKEFTCELGVSTYVGRRVWSITHKIRISLGPMSWADYNRFAPGGHWNLMLRDIVRSYLGDEIDWDLKLVLAAGQVQRLKLDRTRSLGFNSWAHGGGRLDTVCAASVNNRLQLSGAVYRQH